MKREAMRRQSLSSFHSSDQIFECLARANQVRLPVTNEDLGWQEPRVVVGGHRESVCPGVAESDDVADFRLFHGPCDDGTSDGAGEDISRLADVARYDELLLHLFGVEVIAQRCFR